MAHKSACSNQRKMLVIQGNGVKDRLYNLKWSNGDAPAGSMQGFDLDVRRKKWAQMPPSTMGFSRVG
jgi:hypothetical protein